VQVTITAVDWADPVGAGLRRQYRRERGLPLSAGADDAARPDRITVFLIARDRLTRTPVACGALSPSGVDLEPNPEPNPGPDAGQVALISWLFVVPEHRGRELARLVVAELELQARALGWLTVRIETAADRPAALALCTAAGYERTVPEPSTPDGRIVFEKRLRPGHHA
jgi:GNAT superfamily N-acetyltransferase